MNKLVFYILLSFIVGCSSLQKEYKRSNASTEKSIYCGCLIFMDDVYKAEDLNYVLQFQPNTLIRSWYRWGEPTATKQYTKRSAIIDTALSAGVSIGGGASLSFINDADLARQDFNSTWLSVDMSGNIVNKSKKFATLSAPGFRSYLVKNIMEQVRIGIKEIHLGESNGEIHFDDWSLGLKGDSGFIQWVRIKYSKKDLNWWTQQFGVFGKKIYKNEIVDRNDFINLQADFLENFQREWGNEGSWEGLNKEGKPAFLASLYQQNLDRFMAELRAELTNARFGGVSIDIWGFAKWMSSMINQPNAYMSSPPDERWRLNWSTDEKFDLEKNHERIKAILLEQINSVKPVPVVYMIDHPKPFENFKKLSDERQAQITGYFAALSRELGANFVFRAYGNERNILGSKTSDKIKAECAQRKSNYCPAEL